ncbi:MAG: sensor histidine kinase [Lysobacter sp.]|nr:sensor histidine kinase [Lysobacter sp.]
MHHDDSPLLHTLQSHDGSLLQRIFTPLNLAAYVTWIAICIAIMDPAKLRAADPREWAGMAALIAMIVLFVISASRRSQDGAHSSLWNIMAQGLLVVAAEWLLLGGQTAVLLIIVAGQIVLLLSPRMSTLFMLALNVGIAALWVSRGNPVGAVLLSMLPVLGFQAFAALTGHYASTRESAREHLAQVNAELLATRRLLEESARAGERLKLSRELHDVAGHTLTALKLNLARLARDPVLAGREELQTSSALADELLGQIRQVVSTLRAHDGLDLRAALEALAHPVPGVRIAVDMQDQLRVGDIEQAEVLLRCAQEAITNALRHGRAGEIRLGLHRTDDAFELSVENDGIAPARIEYGNGLTGMRERLDAVGGTLEVTSTPPRGLRLLARMPHGSLPERTP